MKIEHEDILQMYENPKNISYRHARPWNKRWHLKTPMQYPCTSRVRYFTVRIIPRIIEVLYQVPVCRICDFLVDTPSTLHPEPTKLVWDSMRRALCFCSFVSCPWYFT